MQLARITHIRCAEPVATTFVWVPDDLDADVLEAAVARAKAQYLAAEAAFAAAGDRPTGARSRPDFEAHPDMRVRDVIEMFEAEQAAVVAWEARRREARRSFAEHLCAQLDGATPFWDHDLDLGIACDWGHRHDTHVEYGATRVADLRGAAGTAHGPEGA